MAIKWGMILAAGLGTRLRPLTLERPKPLMEVLGEPLLVHSLQHMKRAGVQDVVINLHYLPEQIRAAMGETHLDMRIHYSFESDVLGTGGGVKNVESLLRGDEPFLLMNGDTYADFDIRPMIDSHLRRKAHISMLLKEVPNPDAYGAISTDADDRVIGLAKFYPLKGFAAKRRMFCGVHVLSPRIFDDLPSNGTECTILLAHQAALERGNLVIGHDLLGLFSDVGTAQRLHDANMAKLATTGSFIDKTAQVDESVALRPPYWIGPNSIVSRGATVGPRAIVGPGATVGEASDVSDSVLLSGALIASRRAVKGALIGRSAEAQA